MLGLRIALETRDVHGIDSDAAQARWTQLYEECLHTLGSTHATTLDTGYALARLRAVNGDFAGALALADGITAIRVRISGAGAAEVILNRTEMAYWRGLSGDTRTAATELDTLLPALHRVLGADHTATVSAAFNRALWEDWSEDAIQALATWESIETTVTRLFGDDHPSTAQARLAVAFWKGRPECRAVGGQPSLTNGDTA
ncbi:hypothetical protein ACRCUN_23600 [Mycobacterium sp. LTG2003]